jgi:4a-hydroxytetrahydrobiopterin dehydratase
MICDGPDVDVVTALSPEAVKTALAGGDLDGWSLDEDGGQIVKEFTFRTFLEAVGFINRLAPAAEAANHHPDLENHYNRVRVALHTWSEHGITEKDLSLAREIEAASADPAGP